MCTRKTTECDVRFYDLACKAIWDVTVVIVWDVSIYASSLNSPFAYSSL